MWHNRWFRMHPISHLSYVRECVCLEGILIILLPIMSCLPHINAYKSIKTLLSFLLSTPPTLFRLWRWSVHRWWGGTTYLPLKQNSGSTGWIDKGIKGECHWVFPTALNFRSLYGSHVYCFHSINPTLTHRFKGIFFRDSCSAKFFMFDIV